MPRPPVRRLTAMATVAISGVALLGACGKDDKSSSSTTLAPEEITIPMADVVVGLPKIVVLGNKAASEGQDGDYDDADAETGRIEDIWKTVEGTVKATDEDTYEKIETAQGLIKDGAQAHNAERIQEGAQQQSDAVDAFIAAHH